jgi:hypothetical protein
LDFKFGIFERSFIYGDDNDSMDNYGISPEVVDDEARAV